VCMHNMPRDANVGPVELTDTNRMHAHKRYSCRVRHNILLLLYRRLYRILLLLLLRCDEIRYAITCIL